ncbi:MAG: DASH family cryptochrome [Saprospiraceae bacterium]|nr:DASH family cryptochrome [Saprospiraceae bacterium]
MHKKRAIIWFRQDLRLHDNEALSEALQNADEVIPIYVFDERIFKGKTSYGFPKTNKFRAKFIIESVQDLRNSLCQLGSNLIVRVGKPEEEIFKIAQEARTSWVFCNRERTRDEVEVQDALEKNLWSIGQEIRYSRGKMLYYTADLPFPVTHTPDTFTQFRKEVEKYVQVREPLPAPAKDFPMLTLKLESGKIPSLQDFGWEDFQADKRAVIAFKGGETEGLKRLQYYIWDTNLVKNYKETRNGLIGGDYSSKFSPWLAQGCLSPKQIYQELRRFEMARGANESTYWLFFELLWRDFFRFMAKKYENKIFVKGGTRGHSDSALQDDWSLFEQWSNGRTGVPFIDANMRELNATGFMSNRGRQNVASFLVKDLRVNWQMGAEYFESLLIDYDVSSNWGNWNYIAGVGSDPREDRYFNILSQARRYDPHGEYVKLWLPELSDIPIDKIHQPDQLSYTEQESLHLKIGTDYPKAMVATSKWE